MRYIYNSLKLLLILILLCVSAITWSIYTQSGRDFLVHFINAIPFPKGVIVKVEKIHSGLPLHVEFAQFTFEEKGDVWLDVAKLEITVDVLKFIKRNALKAEVTAEQLQLTQIPTQGDSQNHSHDNATPDLLGITADVHVHINRIVFVDYLEDEPILLNDFDAHAHYAEKVRINLRSNITNFGDPLYLKGMVSGDLNDLEAQINLASSHFQYQEYFMDRFELRGNFTGLPSNTKGNIVFKANPMELGVIGGSFLVEHKNDKLHVDIPSIKSDYLVIKGLLDFDFSSGNAHAKLQGELLKHSIKGLYSIETGSFDTDFKLTDDILSGSAQATIDTFKGYDSRIDTLQMKARIQDLYPNGSANVDLQAEGIEGWGVALDTLALQGSLAGGKASLNLHAEGPELTSKVSGSLQQKDLGHLITFERADLQYNKLKVNLINSTQLFWRDEQLTIPTTKFTIGEGGLSLSGKLGAKLIDLNANLNFSLESLALLFLPPEHYLEGNLSSTISLKGTIEAPRIKGNLILADGLYENLQFGAFINDIQSRIDATGQRIDITSFTAKSHNEGDINLSGYVDLGSEKVNLNLKGNSFKLLDSEMVETSVKDVSINLAGRLSDLTCSGNLSIAKGSLDIGVNQAAEIKEIKGCEEPAADIQQSESNTASTLPIKLDLSIESQPQFKVYGRGLNSLWAGNLKVKGNVSEPLISGDIELDRGTFKFLSTEMTLDKGNVIFSGSPDNIPYFKVVTTTDNADYKMKVVIRGTPQDIYFDFSSTPSLSRDEIISQILFGKLSKDLTAFEAIQLARSIAALTGGGSSTDVMGELSEALGVDFISVDFDQQQSSASIHIEKRLNDRVKIITEQSSDVEESSVGVEVKVLENLTVNTERGLVVPDEKISVNYKYNY